MIVMITSIFGSSLLKPFAKCIGMADDDNDKDPINYHRMLDERLTKSDSISNYYNIGLGYESESQNPASDNEANLTTTKKI
jgi:hypothetical protein